MFNLCAPAIIYLFFSATQIIIDIFKGLYNTAFMKFIVMVMITILLNILCQNGLHIVSWIIVFIPFLLMTVIVSMLLYIFGLNASTGTLNTCKTCPKNTSLDSQGNIIIYDPYYNPSTNPVYYSSPNIIVPKPPTTKTTTTNTSAIIIKGPPKNSSDPSYQS
jgi:hypothetical protein